MSRFHLLSFVTLAATAAACSQTESTQCGTDGPICPPGWECITELSACINPLETTCGNGIVEDGSNGTEDRGEKCDDGNLRNGDGCSWNCQLPRCGDRLVDTYLKDGVDFTELCDDGNTNDGDDCAAGCDSVELCGDGKLNPVRYKLQTDAYELEAGSVVSGAEACDPAPGGVNEASTADCNLDCTESRCGDGKVNAASGETCDPGTGTVGTNDRLALAPSADCNADCTVATCGDGKTNPAHLPKLGSTRGEQCDLGRFCADPELTPCTRNEDCLALQTGGSILGDVECKTRELPCCTGECFSTTCGDNILQSEFVFPAGLPQAARDACQAAWVPEQCDTGTTVNNDGDGCDSTCKTEECGDGQRSPHAFRRLRSLFAEGSPNSEGTGLEYEFEPSDPVTAVEVCDDGKHCSVNGKLCVTDDDCLDNQGGVIGDGRCVARGGDGCSADCLSIETCGSGDGFWNDYPIEVLQKGEDLLPVAGPNGQPIVIRSTPAEVCDDGNNTDGDGCAANCFSSGICGNGILDTGELCDYGRTFNGSGLTPDKLVEAFCLADALPEPQACDFPCNRDCTLNVQGDRKLDPGEQCDDGKTCANGIACEENADCAEIGGTDLDCKHRDDDNCTFSGRLNLCGDGLANTIGGWSGLDNLTIDARAELEARYGPGGIPLQVCDSSGINTVACDRDCTLPVCGDVVVCVNLSDPSTCLPNTPLVNFTKGETCDNGVGLAAGLTVESANCNTNCQIAFCGDGVTNVTRGEVCDDTNLNDGDGCAGNCRSTEICGDAIANRYTITLRNAQNQITTIRPAEVCDDGPTGSPSCTADCQSIVDCGDRYVNSNETCDDGNTTVNDGCSGTCQTETGWSCPTRTVTVPEDPSPPIFPGSVTYTTSQRCTEVCGDGLVAGDETCDNGRQCSNGTACTVNGQCAGVGDGLCQVRAGDGCSATCRTEVGWSCASTTAGPNTLHRLGGVCVAVCGDRLLRAGEQCDDGNVDSGDGCSNACVRESGYTCPCNPEPGFVCGTTGGIGGACGSVCGDGGVIGFEECDDGRHCLVSLGTDGIEGTGDDVLRACTTNANCLGTDANPECKTRSGDGCNAGCRSELGWACPEQGGVCLPECGDFVIRGVEDCDDGRQCLNTNTNARTPCSTNANCAAIPGDGICATRSGDGCAANCNFEPGYSCPAGLEVIGGECVAICGDDLVRGAEECDDGGQIPGDGCDSGCRVEPGWDCPISIGVNGEGGPCVRVAPVGELVFHVREAETLTIADIRDELFADDQNIDLSTFTLRDRNGQVATASSCGGALTFDQADTEVSFAPVLATAASTSTPGCVVPNPGPGLYQDSFDYRACTSSDPTAACTNGRVTVVVNRKPSLGDSSRCFPTGTISAELDLAPLYTDPDANAIAPTTITSTGGTGTHTRTGTTVRFQPTSASTATTYALTTRACDDSPTSDCDEGAWNLTWNDAPQVASRTGASATKVFLSTAATPIPVFNQAGSVVVGPGAVTTTYTAVTVSGFANGPFATSVTTLRGSCAVSAGNITYTAGAQTGTDSCFVRVCEDCSGTEVCSVAQLDYNIVSTLVVNEDQVFGVEAADPTVAGASASFTVAGLISNDQPAGLVDFDFIPNGMTVTTLCSGTVTRNGDNLTYVGDSDIASGDACRTQDSFTYEACSPDIQTECDSALVNIEINQRPTLDDVFTCNPTSFTTRQVNVRDLFDDLDVGDELANTSIQVVRTGGTAGSGGSFTRNGSVATWIPTPVSTPARHELSITACDDATVPGCRTSQWVAIWNDAPVLRSFSDAQAIPVAATEAAAGIPLRVGADGVRIIVNTGVVTGVQAPADAIASIGVGALSIGPFSASTATSGGGGTCAIVGDSLVYTAGSAIGVDSCFVQVCETCSGNNVCSVTRVPFKVVTLPVANLDTVLAVEQHVEPSAAQGAATGTFPIATLVANDTNIASGSFVLIANPGGAPACPGRTVSVVGANVVYSIPAGRTGACITSDSFYYRVSHPDLPTRTSDGRVVVELNLRPTLTPSAFTCMPVNSLRGDYTVGAPNFSDPDGDGVGAVSFVTPPNTGFGSVSGATASWVPNDRTEAAYFDLTLGLCDNAASPACGRGAWRLAWNDLPLLSTTFSANCETPTNATLCAATTSFVTLPLEGATDANRLISSFGAVTGVQTGSPLGLVTVTAQPATGFGTCSIEGGTTLRYQPGTSAGNATCTVRVCETCNGGDVCRDRIVNLVSVATPTPVADTFTVLSTVTLPGVSATVDADFFMDNDGANLNRSSFELVGGPTTVATSCGGTATVTGTGLNKNVDYTRPSNANMATCTVPYVDTFQYRLRVAGTQDFVTGNVTVLLNRPPTLDLSADFVCRPTGTTSVTLDITSRYTDPNDPTGTLSALTATTTPVNYAAGNPSTKVVTLTPPQNTGARYAVSVTATDNASDTPVNGRGSATSTWNVVWNDPPALTTHNPYALVVGGSVDFDFNSLVVGTNGFDGLPVGTVGTVERFASVGVGSAVNGPFSVSTGPAVSVNTARGTCSVTGTVRNAVVQYTATSAAAGTDSCFVQVCEVCSSNPVCAVRELLFVAVEANNDTVNVAEGIANTIAGTTLVGNDVNAAVATLQLLDTGAPVANNTPVTTTNGGTATFNGTSVSYTAPNAFTTDSFSYRVCNGTTTSVCDTAVVTLNINQQPNLAAASICVALNTASVSFDLDPTVSPTFTDPDLDGLGLVTPTASVPAVPGTVTPGALAVGVDPNELRFTPTDASDAATYTASYEACDDGDPAACQDGTWVIIYNDAPTIKAGHTVTVLGNATLTATTGTAVTALVANFGDVTTSVVTVEVSEPLGNYGSTVTLSNGTLTVQPDNTISFVAGTSGTDTFFVRICECNGVCDTEEVTVTLSACFLDSDCGTNEVCGPSGCVECLDGGDCDFDAALAACNTTTNVCVECVGNGNCTTNPDGPVCNTTTNLCVECTGNGNCTANPNGTVCDTGAGVCVECTDTADCGGGDVCDTTDNVCVECLDTTDCIGDDVCDTTGNVCVECLGDLDCTGNVNGTTCDTDTNLCVECTETADCTGDDVCDLSDNSCVGCLGDGDCTGNPNGTTCNLTTNVCVQCTDDTDCTGNPSGANCNTTTNLCVGCVDNADCTTAGQSCGTGNTCRANWNVSYCELQFPTAATVHTGGTVDVYVRFYAAGLTDTRGSLNDNDTRGLIRVGAGYGTTDTVPPTGWTWSDNGVILGESMIDPDNNNDEWRAIFTAPGTSGSYDFAGRVSGDGGQTWLYCDRSGVNGPAPGTGYLAVDAGDLTVISVPGAPTAATATRGNAQANVSWTAPASTGGSPITGYTVTSSPGSFTCTTAALNCNVTGLTNGTSYTFTVVATNTVGNGAASAASNAVIPATVPGAPTAASATRGNAQATVSWTAPVVDGGSAVTGYTVTSSPGSLTCTSTAPTTTCNVTGLTNGTPYTFTVVATNAVGNSTASSATNAVTPATVPGAPTAVEGIEDVPGTVFVDWTAPADGGSPITGYTATLYQAGNPTAFTCTVTPAICSITSVPAGTYTAVVFATNAVGNSVNSAPSASFTVTAPP